MKKKTQQPVTFGTVRKGDRVLSPDGDAFVVSGIRTNPLDFRIRLYDEDSKLRAEAAPEEPVEVSREL